MILATLVETFKLKGVFRHMISRFLCVLRCCLPVVDFFLVVPKALFIGTSAFEARLFDFFFFFFVD